MVSPEHWLRRMRRRFSLHLGREAHGHIDQVSEGLVEGWAASARRSEPISVDIEVDGKVAIQNVIADRHRTDVEDAGYGNGPHGFAVAIAEAHPYSRVRLLTDSGSVIASYEGRRTSSEPMPPATAVEDVTGAVADKIRPHFDEAFYLDQLNGGMADNLDLVEHYIRFGWAEERDPAPDFSTKYYLEAHPDVAAAGVNPFWHFIVAGRAEGRLAKDVTDDAMDHLARLVSLEERKTNWIRANPPPDGVCSETLEAAFLRAAPSSGRWIIALTHDDFRHNVGGVQFCVDLELVAALDAGYSYLTLFPWQALPTIAEADRLEHIGVLVNGELIGYAPLETVSAAFHRATRGQTARLVVHSLLGFTTESVVAFAHAVSAQSILYWLHDFLWLCSGFTLRRNDLNFCGAPPDRSMACGVCLYGESRTSHLRRLGQFFAKLPVTVVAPSAFMADFWKARSPFPAKEVVVQAPMQIAPAKPLPNLPVKKPRKLRIAFIGATSLQKGWMEFMRVVNDPRASAHASFHHFGSEPVRDARIKTHAVRVSGSNPTAMRDALLVAEIDIVLQWARGPETFSITAHEAISAGAIVVTSPFSGNIAALGRDCASVVVHDDPDSLVVEVLFGAIAQRALKRANSARDICFSRISVDALENLGAHE